MRGSARYCGRFGKVILVPVEERPAEVGARGRKEGLPGNFGGVAVERVRRPQRRLQ